MTLISKKELYDNENDMKQITEKYTDKVVIKTYKKFLGGTQWMFVRSNPPKNYNGCYMLLNKETLSKEEYETNRRKYCNNINRFVAINNSCPFS